MNLDEVKNYLRIDGDDEDEAIQSMLMAAISYIKRATGKNFVESEDGSIGQIEDDALFCMCSKLLVAQWYENRGEQVQSSIVQVNFAVSEMLQHIELCDMYLADDVSGSDTQKESGS